MPLPLQLDHASLSVRDFDAARRRLEATLGFRVTVTPTAPAEHGRIFLDRGYIEVYTPAGGAAPSLPAAWTMYFLRAPDMDAFVARARADGIAVSDPGIYRGHDGDWLDASLDHPAWNAVLPIIVRRLTPADIAADWPPALAAPHPNGARTLAAVTVAATDAPGVARLLARAAGTGAPEPHTSPHWQCDEYPVHLPNGRAIHVLHGKGNGIGAAVFGVADLGRTRAFFAEHAVPCTVTAEAAGDVLWLDASAIGTPIGFTAQVG